MQHSGLVVAVVLAVATSFGLWWRRRSGRLVEMVEPVMLPAAAAVAALGVDPGSARATLLQFSSAFCQPCRATRAVLAEVTAMLPGVAHIEVDAESHLDAVRALGILRTPTVLVIDAAGLIVTRASGQPRKADVIAAVAPLLADE